MLDATPAARALGLAPGSACRLSLIVTALPSGRVLAPEDYTELPGFLPWVAWSRAGWVDRRAAPAPAPASACCHAGLAASSSSRASR